MTVETWRIPIDGMTCASCVARITRAIRKMPGVDWVRVDLDSNSATVAFDPTRTALTSVAAAVEGAGYAVRIVEAAPAVRPEGVGILSGLRRLIRG